MKGNLNAKGFFERYGRPELCKMLFKICKYLVEECGLDVNFMTDDCSISLCVAAGYGQLEVCKYLIGNGA